jgi:hypothetical protein
MYLKGVIEMNEGNMRKSEVLTFFCKLSDDTAIELGRLLHRSFARDCFCGFNSSLNNHPQFYQFDQSVLDFIKSAVEDRLTKMKGGE